MQRGATSNSARARCRPTCRCAGSGLWVDCAHGATYHIAPNVFSELGAEVVTIGCAPNGLNINDGFGPLAPGALCEAVRERRADLGIALDGDGDRLLMVDATGLPVDGDELLFVIADAHRANGSSIDAVVGTVMTNRGLEAALHARGIELLRAKVGDRNVLDLMRERGCKLGGETSGHLVCLTHTTTGDGIVAALQVLHALDQSGRTLCEARQGMVKYPQVLRSVQVAKYVDLDSNAAIRESDRGFADGTRRAWSGARAAFGHRTDRPHHGRERVAGGSGASR